MKVVSIGSGISCDLPDENMNPLICINEDGVVICSNHLTRTIWSPRTGIISCSPFPSLRDQITLIAANVYFTVFATANNEIWTYGMNLIRPLSPVHDHEPILELVSNQVRSRQLVCGYSHVLVVDYQDIAYSFGCGDCGQLGLGRCESWIESPQRIEFPDSSCPLVDSVSAGSFHSAFLLRNGNMYVCGSSDSHRLGLRAHSDASIVTMTYHPSPCPVEDLEEIGFSFDSHDTSGVKLLSCGVWHTVAVLKETNDVYAWGWAKFGQFGSWEETYYPHPTRLSILDSWIRDEEEISQVICGSRFTALLTSFNRLLILGTVNGSFLSQYLDERTPQQQEITQRYAVIREVVFSESSNFSSDPTNKFQMDFKITPQWEPNQNQDFRVLKLATDGLWEIAVLIERNTT